MTLSEKNQTFFQKNHKFLAALLAIALPYAGFNGYQEVQKAYATPAPVSVDVVIEGGISGPAALSIVEVQAMIDKSIGTYNLLVKADRDKAVRGHQVSKQFHEFDQ